jgi:hypothetical protein
MFARTFGALFGQHFLHLSDARHLTGNFNAHLRDSCLVFADEAFYAGDKQHEGQLKRLVTEPTLMIEAKYANAVSVRNCLHLIVASNDDWVVPAGTDERRFFVLDVSLITGFLGSGKTTLLQRLLLDPAAPHSAPKQLDPQSVSSDQATTRSACSTLPLVSGASTSERAKLSAPTQVPIIIGIA